MPAVTFKRSHLNSKRYWQFLRNNWNPALSLSLILIIFSLPAFGLLGGCASGTQKPLNQKSVLNVGMILASGGMGDKSFNDSAYKGLLEAQKRFNIRFETVNFSNKEENLNALRLFARNNYDLIIGIAFENLENIQTIAREFPQTRFAEIDAELTGNNIASIVYREQEADFLIGVLAAKITKTKYVGVIGGTDIPAIRRIFAGFKQGASYEDSGVRIFSDFAGTFSDPQVGLNYGARPLWRRSRCYT